MTSEFNTWYLDDGAVGGNARILLSDLETVRRVGPSIGLVLKEEEREIITDDVSLVATLKAVMPNIRHILIFCAEKQYFWVLQSAMKQLSKQF